MQTISTKRPFVTAFNATIRALKDLGIEHQPDEENKSITASKGVSIISWGEEIQITFETKGYETLIKIESVSSAQIFSWGRNDSNEEEIEGEIRKQLED